MSKTLTKTLSLVLAIVMVLGLGAFNVLATGGNVAKIGEIEYATLAEALRAADSGDIIEIFGGTWDADDVGSLENNEWINTTNGVLFKSLTIQPVEDANVTFTSNVKLGYDDGHTENAHMTVKGLNFENASLSLGDYLQATVENCTFTGTPDGASGALVVIDSCDPDHRKDGDFPASQVTIENCTINGTSGQTPGIRIRNSGNVTLSGNTITNSSHNGILIESNGNIDATPIKTISMTGNTVTEWNYGNEDGGGRAVRLALGGLAEGSTVTITGNTFTKEQLSLDEPDFVKITGAGSANVDLSGNYWNNKPLTEVLNNSALYSVDTANTTLDSVIYNAPAVAQIGNTGYATLAEAVAAVPDNGTETTITMVENATIVGNAGVTIPVGKNVVLDLNGHTVTELVNEDKAAQLITNLGTLTVTDTSAAGTGTLTNSAADGVHVGEWWSTPQYNYATNTIKNQGTLNVVAGTITNTAAGSICYAVDNNSTSSTATLNVIGGQITKNGTPVRLFCNSTTYDNIINVTGGTISGNWCAFWVQLPGSKGEAKKASVNISGGTIQARTDLSNEEGGTSAWYDYSYGDKYTAVRYSISGGKFIANDCFFSEELTGFITGGLYTVEPDASYIAPGYKIVQIPDSASEYAGWYTVGEITTESTEIITTGKDTYTVTTNVLDADKAVLDSSETSVSVASITEESIAAADTKTTDTVSLANIDTKKVAEAAAAMVSANNVPGANTIEVTVSLSKTADNETNLIPTGEAGEVFEVHPVATYVVKDANGDEIENAGGTIDVANTTVGSFTFKLYLGSGFTSGQLVTVEHYGNGDDKAPTETWTKKVQSDDNGLYVELTLSSFSHIAVKANSDPTATVDYTVKIADATSGTAVIYPGDSVTMDVTVSGDDFYGGDFTIEYNETAFVLNEVSLPAGITVQTSHTPGDTTDKTKYQVNYNLVNGGALLTDGSKIFSVIFKAKDTLTATATYDFKVVSASVNYDTNKNADIVDCTENSTFVTNDKVTVNAAKYTVTFDGYSNDWAYSVYKGKGVDTIPTDVQTGYTFKGWALTNTATTALTKDEIRNAAVTANVTYYPVFEAEQYNVTLSGATGDAKATFGQNYIATISDYDANNYDYTVTYKSGTAASKTLTPTDESITIPAADITGDMTVTVEKTLKGFDVEVHADYVTGYTLVLVKAAEGNNSNPIYTYGASGENTGAMFFVKELTKANESKAYGAYAILVEGAITESAARAKVGITSTAATELTVQTDVNATDLVDSSDLQAAFSGYKVQLTLPEQMKIYLRADVNGDYKLDTTDVGLINSNRNV